MWVKTSERAPEKSGHYFVYYQEEDGEVSLLEYCHMLNVWGRCDVTEDDVPSHWQEITYPEPPKLELEEEKWYWIKAKYHKKHTECCVFITPGDAGGYYNYIDASKAEIKPVEE